MNEKVSLPVQQTSNVFHRTRKDAKIQILLSFRKYFQNLQMAFSQAFACGFIHAVKHFIIIINIIGMRQLIVLYTLNFQVLTER